MPRTPRHRRINIPAPLGDTRRPATVEELRARPPRLGDGKVPSALDQLRTQTVAYVESDRAEEPRIDLLKSESFRAGKSMWRISVAEPAIARITRTQHTSTKTRVPIGSVDVGKIEAAGLGAYRPSWVDLSFTPRIAPAQRQITLRRLNGSPVRPTYIFGDDNRQFFFDASWPYGLVGKIFTSEGKVGSAALIGPRHILTASHCIPWNQPDIWIRFIPAYCCGGSLHGIGVESWVSDIVAWEVVDLEMCGYDYAVCRLHEPLGEWLGYFGTNGYSSDWNGQWWWALVGYPVDVVGGEVPSIQWPVSSFDIDGDAHGGLEIETEADIVGGSSGGPMFGWFDGDPRIVGVVSGEEDDWQFPGWYQPGNVIAGGNGMVKLVVWALNNMA